MRSYFTTLIFSNRTLTVIDQAANSGGNFLLTIILAKALVPEDFGFYSAGFMIGNMALIICQTVVAAPAQTLGPKMPPEQFSSYCTATAFIALAVAGFSGAITFVGTIIYGFATKMDASVTSGFLFLAVVVGMQLHLWARRMAYVRNHIRTAAIGSILRYFLQLVAILLIWFSNSQHGAEWNLMVLGVSGLSGAVLTVFLWWPAETGKKYFPFFSAFKHHLNFGKWLLASDMVNWFGSNWFIAITGTLLGAVSLGALRAAQNIAGAAGIIAQIMENTIPLTAARIQSTKGTVNAFKYILRTGIITVGIGSGITLFLVIFSSDIMAFIYTEEYRKFGPLLALIAFTYISSLIVFLLRTIFRTAENLRPVFITQVMVALLTLLSAKFIVSNYGVNGAAAGLLMVQIFSALVLSLYAARLIKQAKD